MSRYGEPSRQVFLETFRVSLSFSPAMIGQGRRVAAFFLRVPLNDLTSSVSMEMNTASQAATPTHNHTLEMETMKSNLVVLPSV